MPDPKAPGPASHTGILLSLVAGFVDTVGFVALFGLFTAHVTGNLVLIGASLIANRGGLVAKLAALPVFLAVVMAVTAFVRARQRSGQGALRPLLAIQVLALGAFATLGSLAQPIADSDAPMAVLAGLFGVAAMSIQNAYSRLLLGALPPTTVMTGAVTQFAVDLTHLVLDRSSQERAKSVERLRHFTFPIAAFASGAIAGALCFSRFGFSSLMVPMFALGWVGLSIPAATAPGAGAPAR